MNWAEKHSHYCKIGQFSDDCESSEYACWAPITPWPDDIACISNSLTCDVLIDGAPIFPDCPFGDDEWNCVSHEECESDPTKWFICENSISSDYIDTTDNRPICIPFEFSCFAGDLTQDCPNSEDISQEFCCGAPGFDGMFSFLLFSFFVRLNVHV